MILYKYMSYNDAIKTIEGSSIGFSQPKHFNDPFDIPYYKPDKDIMTVGDALMEPLRTHFYNSTWADNSAILSLTRTPNNKLMWSHYANNHEGIVIGINVIKANLTDPDSNLIPAQYGSVIYVSERPLNKFISSTNTPIAVGETYNFLIEHYEKLQRLFLHKPISWSYEEEVRVVKCINKIDTESPNTSETKSGRFETIIIGDGRPLFLYSISEPSIDEVYIGMRVDDKSQENLIDQLRTIYPKAKAYKCSKDDMKLNLQYKEV